MTFVEMTKEEKEILIKNKNIGDEQFNHPFTWLMERIEKQSRNRNLGLTDEKYFETLTEEQLMQAWVHPETIKVVDE
ncbi:hypothetical protein [Leuconostoc mesenteroides]|uniref:hypothetical protein n=1 Tax=Leuconostoc mesenteroides TaxID=1245 RepID=UPI0030CA78D3